jgi:hypothetical protein
MKLEIEITEGEIRSAIERKIRVAIADQTNQWGADDYIKKQVKALWVDTVDAMIREELSNSQALREKIALALERKIKAQLNAAMNLSGKAK